VHQHQPAAPFDPATSAVSLSPTTYRTPHSRHQPTEGRSAQRRCEAANRSGDHPKRSLNGRPLRNQVSAARSPGQNNIPSTLEPRRARPHPRRPAHVPNQSPSTEAPSKELGPGVGEWYDRDASHRGCLPWSGQPGACRCAGRRRSPGVVVRSGHIAPGVPGQAACRPGRPSRNCYAGISSSGTTRTAFSSKPSRRPCGSTTIRTRLNTAPRIARRRSSE
jgi:hypothetical protein